MEAKQVSRLTHALIHLGEFDALYLQELVKIQFIEPTINIRANVFCALPEDADIVRGFVKVGGGSGLLSMIVPEAQRSVPSYFTKSPIRC